MEQAFFTGALKIIDNIEASQLRLGTRYRSENLSAIYNNRLDAIELDAENSPYRFLIIPGYKSDFKIICQGEVFDCHQSVVFRESKPLAAHLRRNFKEAITQEIHLPDDHPSIVAMFLEYQYTGTFTLNPSSPSQMEDCTDVYVLAEKFDVPALKVVAIAKFKVAAREKWSEESFVNSLEIMSSNLPENDIALRECAKGVGARHWRVLREGGMMKELCVVDEDARALMVESLACSMTNRGRVWRDGPREEIEYGEEDSEADVEGE